MTLFTYFLLLGLETPIFGQAAGIAKLARLHTVVVGRDSRCNVFVTA